MIQASDNFIQAEKYLDELQMFGMKLGLQQVRELADYAGNPEKNLRFIHIAGSNGKGSCAALLNAALQRAGFKVGFFSSPHLISVRERFRVDGRAISENDFVSIIERLKPGVEKMRLDGRCPTYFEFVTIVAASYFADQQVDFVLWETGMGGRLDATNYITPYCSLITGIALEHQQYLGDSLAAIAGEKAGIVKACKPVFVAELPKAALLKIKNKCLECKSQLFQVNKDCECRNVSIEFNDVFLQHFEIKDYRVSIPLAGPMQRCNCQLVFMVLEYLSCEFGFALQDALDGMKNAIWPGRLQILPDGTVIDGAHNPDGVKKLIDALRETMPETTFTVIFAAFADKDVVGALQLLDQVADRFIFMPLQGPDWRTAYSADELQMMFNAISQTPAIAVNSLDEALLESTSQCRLFAGSLFLAGEVLPRFIPEADIINF